jgi:hypothetical protein
MRTVELTGVPSYHSSCFAHLACLCGAHVHTHAHVHFSLARLPLCFVCSGPAADRLASSDGGNMSHASSIDDIQAALDALRQSSTSPPPLSVSDSADKDVGSNGGGDYHHSHSDRELPPPLTLSQKSSKSNSIASSVDSLDALNLPPPLLSRHASDEAPSPPARSKFHPTVTSTVNSAMGSTAQSPGGMPPELPSPGVGVPPTPGVNTLSDQEIVSRLRGLPIGAKLSAPLESASRAFHDGRTLEQTAASASAAPFNLAAPTTGTVTPPGRSPGARRRTDVL